MNQLLSIIVISGNKQLFAKWLERSFVHLAGNEDRVKLYLVAWGNQAGEIQQQALQSKMTLLEPNPICPGTEANRNWALCQIESDLPPFVGYLDDDTYVTADWISELLRRIEEHVSKPDYSPVAIVSRVKHQWPNRNQLLPYCGHSFVNGLSDICRNGDSWIGICGNSAIIARSAINRIKSTAPGEKLWDPNFRNSSETCLDISIRLSLTGVKVERIDGVEYTIQHGNGLPSTKALADYMIWRLTSLHLLYEKYLSEPLKSRLQEDAAQRAVNYFKRAAILSGVRDAAAELDLNVSSKWQASARVLARRIASYDENRYKRWRELMLASNQGARIFDAK